MADPESRRDRRHRRHRGRARGLPLGQPVDRRRAGQRAGAGRRHRRHRRCRAHASPTRKAFDNSILCTNESVADRRGAGRPTRFKRELGAQRRASARRRRGERDARRAVSRRAASTSSWSASDAARACRRRPGSRCRRRPACWWRRSTLIGRRSRSRARSCSRARARARARRRARRSTRRARSCASAAPATRPSSTRSDPQHDPRLRRRGGGAARRPSTRPAAPAASGFDTNLAPTMTIGTGFFGRSSLAENLQPQHLVQWTRIALPRGCGEAVRRLRHPGLQPMRRCAPGDRRAPR